MAPNFSEPHSKLLLHFKFVIGCVLVVIWDSVFRVKFLMALVHVSRKFYGWIDIFFLRWTCKLGFLYWLHYLLMAFSWKPSIKEEKERPLRLGNNPIHFS